MKSNYFHNKQGTKQVGILAILLLIALTTGFFFINSPYFTVNSILVEGNKYMATEEVLAIALVPEKTNIFRLNIGDIEKKMKLDLRVESIEIIRQYPSTIVMKVNERKPVAYVASTYGFAEIDKNGIVLAAYKNLRQVKVPIITGIKIGSSYVGDKIEDQDVITVLNLIALLDENTLNQLSEISIHDHQTLVAYTITSTKIRLGNYERLAEKAGLMQEVIQDLKQRNVAAEYVDLNFASPVIKFSK